MAIAGKVAITPKGEWNSVSTYEKLDAVSHNNGLYIAKKASSGIIPEDGDVWMLATKSIDMDEFSKIIDGTTIVGEAKKAAQDKDGNNIVDTYQTKTGDTENNTVTFTSGDSTNPTGWEEIVEVASGEKHTSLFRKLSLAVKNLRYLYKMLGTTDISAIGDGSVRGAISELNSSLNGKINSKIGTSNLSHGFGSFTVTLNGQTFENVEIFYIKIDRGDRYLLMGSVISGSSLSGSFLGYNSWMDRWRSLENTFDSIQSATMRTISASDGNVKFKMPATYTGCTIFGKRGDSYFCAMIDYWDNSSSIKVLGGSVPSNITIAKESNSTEFTISNSGAGMAFTYVGCYCLN